MKPIKILFIPVSSTSGVGEYLRSTIIAEHLQQQYPTAEINFILNKNACYAQECQFTTHLCNSSGTKNTPYVKKIIDQPRPPLKYGYTLGCTTALCYASFKLIPTNKVKIISITAT